MNEQGSYDGFAPGAYGAPSLAVVQPPVPMAPVPPLRPLSTGEVLDRTFVLYRHRFWLFAGIGMLPAGLLTLTSMLRLIFVTATHRAASPQVASSADAMVKAMSNGVLLQAYFLPATLLFLVAYGISHAATVHAVTRISSGMATSAGEAYHAIRGQWLRWTGIVLRQFWSASWPMLAGFAVLIGAVAFLQRGQARGGANNGAIVGLIIFFGFLLIGAGLVLGVINFLRNALAVPAGVQEQLGVNAALRRSRALVAGRKGRIFLALLLVYALQTVAGAIQLPLLLIAVRTHGAQQVLLESIELLIQFFAATVVAPIASIALCLFYIDERVRREGYDIELLMQRNFGTPVAPTPSEAQPLA